ncbi:MAG: hypothetical protein JOZ15_15680, partial [Acidobacteria bacterium]|nr:hypothetical protein [Acidobacteriota bacterium]
MSLSPPGAAGPRRRLLAPLQVAAALLLVYTLPTLVFLRPIWTSFGDRIVGRSGDPVLNL